MSQKDKTAVLHLPTASKMIDYFDFYTLSFSK